MTALTAALIQTGAASAVAGVALAWVAYITGVDRLVVIVARHPLRSTETLIAIVLSWLPTPRHIKKGRHRAKSQPKP